MTKKIRVYIYGEEVPEGVMDKREQIKNILMDADTIGEAGENIGAFFKEDRPAEPERWKPQEGESYWGIKSEGKVQQYSWEDSATDRAAWEFSNCFQTRQEAEQAREKMQALLLAFHQDNHERWLHS